ncbi:MAG: ParA family protein, partial [Thiohalomonadales bacterium]
MIVLSVANQKGGVGKTTTVVSLGGLLSLQGYKTLLLDLDPHGSMTSYFRLNPDLIESGVYQLFVNHQEKKHRNTCDYICATKFRDLGLIPASTALATLDRQLGSIDGMGLVISRALSSVFDDYDFAIIDCPPQLGVLMVNALAACKRLIIPVQTEFLALKGLERMMRTLSMIAKAKQYKPDYSILPTMYDQRTRASRSTLSTLRAQYH